MVHAPLVTSTPLFKDKPADHLAPAFTAVNGRTSPPSPQRPNGVNGMSTNSVHLRALSRRSPEHPPDLKIPLPTREWSTASSVIEVERPNGHQNNHQNGHANGHPNSNPNSPEQNGYANGHQNRDSTSPTTPEQSRSPTSPGKRKRSFSPENDRSHRQRLESSRSPDSVQIPQVPVDPSHPRTLPPMERIETDRAWAPPHELPRYHDSRLPTTLDSLELSGTTEMTRAGVQVDPKKRKRQFANRTKTGCGTCRRRKKKCDEAKPECKLLGAVLLCSLQTPECLADLDQATTANEGGSSARATPTKCRGQRTVRRNRIFCKPRIGSRQVHSSTTAIVSREKAFPARVLPTTAVVADQSSSTNMIDHRRGRGRMVGVNHPIRDMLKNSLPIQSTLNHLRLTDAPPQASNICHPPPRYHHPLDTPLVYTTIPLRR